MKVHRLDRICAGDPAFEAVFNKNLRSHPSVFLAPKANQIARWRLASGNFVACLGEHVWQQTAVKLKPESRPGGKGNTLCQASQLLVRHHSLRRGRGRARSDSSVRSVGFYNQMSFLICLIRYLPETNLYVPKRIAFADAAILIAVIKRSLIVSLKSPVSKHYLLSAFPRAPTFSTQYLFGGNNETRPEKRN